MFVECVPCVGNPADQPLGKPAPSAEEVSESDIVVPEDSLYDIEDSPDDIEEVSIQEAFKHAKENGEVDAEWEVASIIGKRTAADGECEYLVQWKDSHSRHNEWKRKSDMDCNDLIIEYESVNSATPANKNQHLVMVGDSWLVPYISNGLQQYCWVIKRQDGSFKCRGAWYFPHIILVSYF